MQAPWRMDEVVVEDYYHVTMMDETMNWMELTHLLSSFFSLNPRATSCTSTFTSTLWITFSSVNTRQNINLSLVYSMLTNASNNIPLYTYIHSYVVWRVQISSPPPPNTHTSNLAFYLLPKLRWQKLSFYSPLPWCHDVRDKKLVTWELVLDPKLPTVKSPQNCPKKNF
jgi:hypothetical protein